MYWYSDWIVFAGFYLKKLSNKEILQDRTSYFARKLFNLYRMRLQEIFLRQFKEIIHTDVNVQILIFIYFSIIIQVCTLNG